MDNSVLLFCLKFILVFVLTTCADIAWTMYMAEVQKMRALRAGLWSTAIVAMGAITFISYMENRWLLIAALLGSFFGTYITVLKMRKSNVTVV